MEMTLPKCFNWLSEVRGYETDFQGIVNNAVYFNYLDHTRCQHLAALGVDIKTCADNHLNLVLIHTEITYHHSLTVGEKFSVKSVLGKISRLKYSFEQTITDIHRQRVIVTAKSICCGVNTLTAKPCPIIQLDLALAI